MNSEYTWWKVRFYLDTDFDNFTHICFNAKSVTQIDETTISVDDRAIFVPGIIIEIINNAVTYDIIKYVLDTYFRFELNNSTTWKKLETYLPGVVCNSATNTTETIIAGVLRFKFENFMYEYGGKEVPIYERKSIDIPLKLIENDEY